MDSQSGNIVTGMINGLVQNIGILIPALIGLAILYLDYRLRRTMYVDAKKERAQRRDWLDQEATEIKGLSSRIAIEAARELTANAAWAAKALESAKLGPYAMSVFGDRREHFREEKNYLSSVFTPLLLRRCRRYIDSNKPVFIIVDSGTTLFPFFEQFGIAAVRATIHQEDWIKKITLVTNNLPGIESLIESGRLDQRERYADLEIACKLLPGTPLPVYSALTGNDTDAALKSIRKEFPNALFIGLVTGNWVRIRRSNPPCPLPLARGKGHLSFKRTLIDVCDEVYVVAPLGKIFVNTSNEDLNKALGFSSTALTPDGQPYEEIKVIKPEEITKIRLISTSRRSHRLLFAHSEVVMAGLHPDLGTDEQFASDLHTTCHLMLPFDTLPDLREAELKTEFPHRSTHKPEILRRFQVS